MPENFDSQENKAESLPMERDVTNRIDEIIDGREYTVIKAPVYDEKGLSRMDLSTTDVDGEKLDISYTRDRISDGLIVPAIHQTVYSGGVPCGVGTQYNFVGGEWVEAE